MTAASPDAWSMPRDDDATLCTHMKPAPPAADAREALDAYTERRLLDETAASALYHNRKACTSQPQLDVSDMGVGAARIPPLHCGALSPALLDWQRREQVAAAGRAADTASGPAVDAMLADPRMGWSDAAAAAATAAAAGGARPAHSGMRSGMRMASGVSMMATHGGVSGGAATAAAVLRNGGARGSPAGMHFSPTAPPLHARADDMTAAFHALHALSRVPDASGRPVPVAMNLKPGAMSR